MQKQAQQQQQKQHREKPTRNLFKFSQLQRAKNLWKYVPKVKKDWRENQENSKKETKQNT